MKTKQLNSDKLRISKPSHPVNRREPLPWQGPKASEEVRIGSHALVGLGVAGWEPRSGRYGCEPCAGATAKESLRDASFVRLVLAFASKGDPADSVFYIQKGKVKVTVVFEARQGSSRRNSWNERILR